MPFPPQSLCTCCPFSHGISPHVSCLCLSAISSERLLRPSSKIAASSPTSLPLHPSFPSPFSLCSSIDLLLFLFIYLFLAAPHGMRDLSFPTTDQTVWTLCTGRQNLNQWTTREIPAYCYLFKYLYIYLFTSLCARALFCIYAFAGHIFSSVQSPSHV